MIGRYVIQAICKIRKLKLYFEKALALILKYTFMAHLSVDLVSFEQRLREIVDIDASWSIGTGYDPKEIRQPGFRTELVINGEVLYDFDSSKSQLDTPFTKENTPSSHSLSSSNLGVEADGMTTLHRNQNGSDSKILNLPSDDKLVPCWR